MKTREGFPLFSVLTTVKNGESSIGCTINSVINQSYPNIEYIIIDGGSTDDTVAVVGTKSNSRIKFFTETDEGVYYGMNNAISKASGDIIAILNSGDKFVDNEVLERIVEIYQSFQEKDLVINGGIRFRDESGNKINDVVRRPSIMKWKYFIMPINHPAFFVPRSVYEKHGVFNVNFNIAADYEFILRLSKQKILFYFIPDICTTVAPLGLSSYGNNHKFILREAYNVRSLYVSASFNNIINIIVASILFLKRVKKKLKKMYLL